MEEKLDILIKNQVTKTYFDEVVKKLDVRVTKNEDDISTIKSEIAEMPNNIYEEIHEQEKKKKNVVIFKLDEVEGVSDKKKKFDKEKEVVQELINNMTDFNLLSEGDLKFRMYRLGKEDAPKPRPMVVSFDNNMLRDKVLESCRNLKGKEKWKRVSVVPDLTKMQQKMAKQMRKKLSEESSKKNGARTEEEIKTIEWKVIGHYGLGNLRLSKITKKATE